MQENVTVEDREKSRSEGTAEVTRFSGSQRLMKAVGVGVGGTILGLCTIIIPGLHFVTTWLLPLLSIGIAIYLYGRKGAVAAVKTTCPACGDPIEAEGGAWEEPMWVRCPKCQAPLQVILANPME